MPEIRDDVVTINGRRYVPEPTYEITEGARRIAVERARQVSLEDWTPEHDDEHANGELLLAAVSYVHVATDAAHYRPEMGAPVSWPWDAEAWKPSDPIRNLEKAGALIAAEIDRLLRRTGEGNA